MFNFAHTKMLSGYPAGRTGVSIGVIYILDNLVHEICMGGVVVVAGGRCTSAWPPIWDPSGDV